MKRFPNWQNAIEYPAENSFLEPERLADDNLHTSKAWAWQFLRRNKCYQHEYDSLRESGSNGMGQAMAEKYGLSMMLPYNEDDPPFLPFQNTLTLRSLNHALKARQSPKLRDFELALVFDLRLPLREQLALAKAQFVEEIHRLQIPVLSNKRKHLHEFIRYLRIIDAKHAGISNRRIAAQFMAERLYSTKQRASDRFYPAQSRVERDWDTAKTIVESGYRSIAYS